MELIKELNGAYRRLAEKCAALRAALSQRGLAATWGWYNGHYRRNAEGAWEMEYFPIPVIGVTALCDIEVGFTGISVTCKLRRKAALCRSYAQFSPYAFEAYGVEDYLSDFYHSGQTEAELKANIEHSAESEIGFQFTFPFDIKEAELLAFLLLLKQEGFYY